VPAPHEPAREQLDEALDAADVRSEVRADEEDAQGRS
jgi:hypothetical protein